MNKTIIKLNAFVILALLVSASPQAQQSGIEAQVREALKSDIRPPEDRQADTYRKPAETLAFFGLKNDMRVLELIPGGGYYTKILGQVLEKNGKLYVGAGGNSVADKLSEWGLEEVEVLDDNFEMTRGGRRGFNTVSDVVFPVDNLDMALTFRNMHNMSPEGRKKLNAAVFEALKPGGIYGVIDHTRRHMEPYNEERWRRVDPVALIKELQEVGFEFVDYSDLHYREHDPLKTDTTVPELNRDSDRFTLKFRKPEK